MTQPGKKPAQDWREQPSTERPATASDVRTELVGGFLGLSIAIVLAVAWAAPTSGRPELLLLIAVLVGVLVVAGWQLLRPRR